MQLVDLLVRAGLGWIIDWGGGSWELGRGKARRWIEAVGKVSLGWIFVG